MDQRDIQQFKELFSQRYGKTLTDAEATEKLIALLGIMRIVYKPISEEQFREIQEWRKQRNDLKKNIN